MNGTNCQMIVLMLVENCLTLDKPMASLSTCHLELVVWYGNLVKSC